MMKKMLLLICTLLLAITWLVTTHSGFAASWYVLKKMLPGQLTITAIDGTWASGIQIKQLTYADDNAHIAIDTLAARWHAMALLQGKLSLESLNANHVDITLYNNATSATTESADFTPYLAWLPYVNITQASITHAEVHWGDATLRLSGGVKKSWQLIWQIDLPHLQQITTEMSGSLKASGQVWGERLQPQLQASLQLKDFISADLHIKQLQAELSHPANKILTLHTKLKAQKIRIQAVDINTFSLFSVTTLREGRLINLITTYAKPFGRAHGEVILPDVQWDKLTDLTQTITGKLTVAASQLPYLHAISQQLDGVVQLNGTIASPIFNINSRLQLGKGTSALTGKVSIDQGDVSASLHLQGNDLTVINDKKYKLNLSPDLQLDYQSNQVKVTGSVDIPYALFQPKHFGDSVDLPSEVVFVDQPQQTPALPTNIQLQVRLNLGNEIKIQYKNINTALKGSLLVSKNNNNPITATGELQTVSGTYRAYGRVFTIRQGRLIYAGNLLTNPGLDISAIRTLNHANTDNTFAQQVSVVGIRVHGTVNQPYLTLFSEPPGLNQTDILSYILLGHPASAASVTSGLTLLTMAAGGADAPDVSDAATNKIQHKLGLSELSIGSTEYYNPTVNTSQTTTAMNVGKNINKRLSLRYTYSLFEQVSILSLRYQISNHFALQSETSTLENGGDLLYQFESSH